ncbi:hypothetical protein, partial [Streptomyces clavuligerus]|uniref:hypothetical protein n=1 Tax=Streptomyces clavuligerus TaxID=1901 RepID=UPI0018D1308B
MAKNKNRKGTHQQRAAAAERSKEESRSTAFEELGHTRKGLVAHHEPMIDNVVAVKRKEAEGQFDLFGGMG